MDSWKRDFASGLIVVLPVLVLVFALQWLYSQLLKLPLPEIDITGLQPYQVELVQVVLTLILFVVITLAVGYLMRTTAGRIAEGALDDIINRVPVLRVVYNASKLAVETAVSGTGELQKPVKLEMWQGARMTAFKTGKSTPDGRDVLFMPTAPNITTGFVIEVEPEDYTETDEKVEEALTRILSAGFGETSEEGIPIDVVDEGSGKKRRVD
jgi:uncharacterized membrane protein